MSQQHGLHPSPDDPKLINRDEAREVEALALAAIAKAEGR